MRYIKGYLDPKDEKSHLGGIGHFEILIQMKIALKCISDYHILQHFPPDIEKNTKLKLFSLFISKGSMSYNCDVPFCLKGRFDFTIILY